MTLSSTPGISETKSVSPNSAVLREYTSPTCKLEISANPSPLEKWTRKPTLKNQRFLLKFEDPRLSEDQWTTVRGDRIKLAALTESVTTYVQTFLSQSRTITQPEANTSELTGTFIAEPSTALDRTHHQGISLEPSGLLSHTLYLGRIATEATGDRIKLTSTQLADLASVLEEHGSSTIDLPVLNRDTAWMRSPATWGKIAAVSLMSVGITASVLNQFSPKKPTTEIASQASSSDQRSTPTQVPQPSLPSIQVSPGGSLPTGQMPPVGVTGNSGTNSSPIAQPGAIASNPDSENTANPSQTNSSGTQTQKTEGTTSGTQTTGDTSNPNTGKKAGDSGKDLKIATTEIPAPASNAARQKQTPSPSNESAAASSPNTSDSAEPAPPELSIPEQIQAIRKGISTQWSPRTKISESIRYTVVIANGKVLDVKSESDSSEARAFVTSAVPLIQSIVGSGSQNYSINLVLSPNGSVIVE